MLVGGQNLRPEPISITNSNEQKLIVKQNITRMKNNTDIDIIPWICVGLFSGGGLCLPNIVRVSV